MIKLHTLLTLLMSNNSLLGVIKLFTDTTYKRQVIINQRLLTLMLNPFDHATHIVVFNIPLLDPLIDTRSLVKMRPYACGLHDGAEVGSF